MNLSTTDPAIKRLSSNEYDTIRVNRKEKDKLIAEVLKPIQQCIIRDYGEHTASFMLSNRIMQQIAFQGLSELPKYRQTMLRQYADELKIVSPLGA
ncbi:MAG: hypothetical protein JKY53_04140 [Flavobacteriales bacterium]|nr:hypothetical protein [Flavobacteriales bacterium]